MINISQLKLMGICNLTPDSFSDGGNLQRAQDVLKQIHNFKDHNFKVIDIGAESTAPFNEPISQEEEERRLESLIPWNQLSDELEISIDTYRGSVFQKVYKRIKEKFPHAFLIWNDISGKLDEELWETLACCPEAQYVFCHNLAPDRAQSSSHMSFLWEGEDIFDSLLRYFQNALTEFRARGQELRVILDPCFGFSKTREQNHNLLKRFNELISSCDHNRFLLGISRKSFLRFSDFPRRDPRLIQETEFMQALFLGNILSDELHCDELYLRLHDAVLGKSLTYFTNT